MEVKKGRRRSPVAARQSLQSGDLARRSIEFCGGGNYSYLYTFLRRRRCTRARARARAILSIRTWARLLVEDRRFVIRKINFDRRILRADRGEIFHPSALIGGTPRTKSAESRLAPARRIAARIADEIFVLVRGVEFGARDDRSVGLAFAGARSPTPRR